ncbi:MAG: hypothetical protein WD942_02455 [Dehalococcoidia bacterium]
MLDFTPEPVLIIRRSGEIEMANASARARLGTSLVGRNLGAFTTTAPDVLHAYLRRCAASGSPVIAAMMLHNGNGEQVRFQIKGALLGKQPGPQADRIVLRCSATAFGDFTRFSRRVEELNEENRRQRHARAVLEETLSQRDLLLREVQHRVRNHTQMMLGMVAAARRKAEGEELHELLYGAHGRQAPRQLFKKPRHTSAQLEALSAQRLIEDLCGATAQTCSIPSRHFPEPRQYAGVGAPFARSTEAPGRPRTPAGTLAQAEGRFARHEAVVWLGRLATWCRRINLATARETRCAQPDTSRRLGIPVRTWFGRRAKR